MSRLFHCASRQSSVLGRHSHPHHHMYDPGFFKFFSIACEAVSPVKIDGVNLCGKKNRRSPLSRPYWIHVFLYLKSRQLAPGFYMALFTAL
jgi:hypothetical protein